MRSDGSSIVRRLVSLSGQPILTKAIGSIARMDAMDDPTHRMPAGLDGQCGEVLPSDREIAMGKSGTAAMIEAARE